MFLQTPYWQPVGQRIDSDFYTAAGIQVNESGRAVINEFTMETSIENVYVAGDGVYGPATVVSDRDCRDSQRYSESWIGQITDFQSGGRRVRVNAEQ